jgi:hypothetical protein
MNKVTFSLCNQRAIENCMEMQIVDDFAAGSCASCTRFAKIAANCMDA